MKDATLHQNPLPWNAEPEFMRLSQDTSVNGSCRFFRYDIWHTIHMGIGKAFVSSLMTILASLLPAPNVDLRFEILSQEYRRFCQGRRRHRYLLKLDKHTFNASSAQEPTGCWNKAAVTSNLLEFAEDWMERNKVIWEGDERMRFCVALLSKVSFAFYNVVLCKRCYIQGFFNSRLPLSKQSTSSWPSFTIVTFGFPTTALFR